MDPMVSQSGLPPQLGPPPMIPQLNAMPGGMPPMLSGMPPLSMPPGMPPPQMQMHPQMMPMFAQMGMMRSLPPGALFNPNHPMPPMLPRPPMPPTHVNNSPDMYNSLCINNLPQDAGNETVAYLKDQFQVFGPMNVRIANYMHRKVAYVNFPTHQAADAAYQACKSKMVDILSKGMYVEPVIGWSTGGAGAPIPSKMERIHQNSDKPPEDDCLATRTLFVGNLDPNLRQDQLLAHFSRYGDVYHVDVKAPVSGKTNAYAFVKFKNVSMAYNAKMNVSGRRIGKYDAKVGYGKVVPQVVLWVGNIPSYVTPAMFNEMLYSVTGISGLERPETGDYALILFDTAESARVAAEHLRGQQFREGPRERRLRVDYVSSEEFDINVHNSQVQIPLSEEELMAHLMENDALNAHVRLKEFELIEPESLTTQSRRTKAKKDVLNKVASLRLEHTPIGALRVPDTVKSVSDVVSCLPRVWQGIFRFKKSVYGVQMHLVSGNYGLVDDYLRPSASFHVGMRISEDDKAWENFCYRFRHDRYHFCALIAQRQLTRQDRKLADEELKETCHPRPLKDMVSYLTKRECTAVFNIVPPTEELSPDNGEALPAGVCHLLRLKSKYAKIKLRSLAPTIFDGDTDASLENSDEVNDYLLLYLHRVDKPPST